MSLEDRVEILESEVTDLDVEVKGLKGDKISVLGWFTRGIPDTFKYPNGQDSPAETRGPTSGSAPITYDERICIYVRNPNPSNDLVITNIVLNGRQYLYNQLATLPAWTESEALTPGTFTICTRSGGLTNTAQPELASQATSGIIIDVSETLAATLTNVEFEIEIGGPTGIRKVFLIDMGDYKAL